MSEVVVAPSRGMQKAVVIRIYTQDAAKAYADLLLAKSQLPGGKIDTGFRDDAVAIYAAIEDVWPEPDEDTP